MEVRRDLRDIGRGREAEDRGCRDKPIEMQRDSARAKGEYNGRNKKKR